jgi:hypothetical protein
MQAQMREVIYTMPVTGQRIKQMLRAAINAGTWTHCFEECNEAVKVIFSRDFDRILSCRGRGGQRHDACDAFQIGDASKLCLIVSMLLASTQLSSSNLVALSYVDHNLSLEGANNISEEECTIRKDTTRKRVIDALEQQFRLLLQIVLLVDSRVSEREGDYEYHADTAVRGALMHVTFLKNEERLCQDEQTSRFLQEVATLVQQSKLHEIEGEEEKGEEGEEHGKKERRRRLFYQFYIQERINAAHWGTPVFLKDGIKTQTPSPTKGVFDSFHSFLIKTDLANILSDATNLLHNGASSFDEILQVEERFKATWRHYLSIRRQHSDPDKSLDSLDSLDADLQKIHGH